MTKVVDVTDSAVSSCPGVEQRIIPGWCVDGIVHTFTRCREPHFDEVLQRLRSAKSGLSVGVDVWMIW